MAHTDTVDCGFITGPVNKGDGKEYGCLSHVIDLCSIIDRHLGMESDGFIVLCDKGEHHEEDDDDYDDDGDDKEDDRSTEAMTDDGNSLSSLASGEDYTAEELADAQNQLGGQNIALLAREQDDDDNQVLLMEVSDDEDGSVDMLDASSVDSFVEENEEKDEAEVEDITVLEKVFLDIDEGFTA
ncbi:hypothetical protein JMJ77_0013310 [Colletotrichum scovillei]|uniref:Uncharacterized protein n=1 Tax=Colletotrichum scovillei TaxID=1209932 RepID=A0A9P7R5H4_9PEZI|nr:hypothetical protein JMJ77_0013310 [Colletotrichum scovillei]KAG7069609.1 hypothetical protein JMJ76_0003273 [Colletotrichum scovillei]KAG7073610.1 hypothetical protein JMJ78_0014580 [Colletotrichum scovillei]